MRLTHLVKVRRWFSFLLRPTAFYDGHFYSPVVNPAELNSQREALWPSEAPHTPGIVWSVEAHRQLLLEWHAFAADWDYPSRPANATGFYEPNKAFEGLDSRVLYAFLRLYKPKKLIEVGSGFSTLLSADVNARHLDGSMEIIAIEPYPKRFLQHQVQGLSQLIRKKVQDVPMSTFDSLGPGDVLFIDSSHVVKTASDVNFLYLQVLPRLKAGVIVHIHDIFLPWDYPCEWVMRERRNWNEQYCLQAMLAAPSRFQVLFANHFASRAIPDAVETCWGEPLGGGSIWLVVN